MSHFAWNITLFVILFSFSDADWYGTLKFYDDSSAVDQGTGGVVDCQTAQNVEETTTHLGGFTLDESDGMVTGRQYEYVYGRWTDPESDNLYKGYETINLTFYPNVPQTLPIVYIDYPGADYNCD